MKWLSLYREANGVLKEITSGVSEKEISDRYKGNKDTFDRYQVIRSILESELGAIQHTPMNGYQTTNRGRKILYTGGVVRAVITNNLPATLAVIASIISLIAAILTLQ